MHSILTYATVKYEYSLHSTTKQSCNHTHLCIHGSAVLTEDFFKDGIVSQLRLIEVTRKWPLDSHTIHCTHTVRGRGGSKFSMSIEPEGGVGIFYDLLDSHLRVEGSCID